MCSAIKGQNGHVEPSQLNLADKEGTLILKEKEPDLIIFCFVLGKASKKKLVKSGQADRLGRPSPEAVRKM